MKTNFRHNLANEEGFTLIEVLVVIALIGVMAMVTISLAAVIFNSVIQGQQMTEELWTSQTAYGYLNSHLGNADRPVGLLTAGDTSIAPVSIAGDQLIFQADGLCYRIFYLEVEEQLRAQVASTCDDPEIAPVRGPNELAANGTRHAAVTDLDYDPALDAALGTTNASFVLADGIVPEKPNNAPAGAPSPLQVFSYKTDEGITLLPDTEASNDPSGHTSFYSDPENSELVAGVQVTLYVKASGTDEHQLVQPKAQVQTIWIGQTFTDATAPGATPSRGRVDGSSTTTWITVTNAAGWLVASRDAISTPLRTPSIGTQDAWIEFDGQLGLRPKISTVTGAEIKAELLKNDVVVTTGRTVFSYPTGQVTTSKGVPFSGYFQIPVGTVLTTDTYRVRISVRNLDASHELEYSTGIDTQWLNWKIVTD